MPVDPDDIEAIVADVSAIYREGELALLHEVADHLRRRSGAPSGSTGAPIDAPASLRRAAGSAQAAMEADGARALRGAISAAWRLGARAAAAEFPDQRAPRAEAGPAADTARTPVPPQAADALTTELVRDVGDRVRNVPRDTLAAFRSAVEDAAARMSAGGQNRRSATQAAWSALVRRGVIGFTDRAGKRWRLHSYVEMAVRTAAMRAAVDGQADRLTSLGIDLVSISDHARECELCRPWEGRILRLSAGPVGRVDVPHALDDEGTLTVDVAGTVATARAAGLWHPNCLHSMSAFLPGVTRIPEPSAEPEEYAARMRQREIERRIRRWREQESAATTDEARTAARRKVQAWRAAMREHLAAHPGLKRVRHREQIGAGSPPPAGDGSSDAGTPLDPGGAPTRDSADGATASGPDASAAPSADEPQGRAQVRPMPRKDLADLAERLVALKRTRDAADERSPQRRALSTEIDALSTNIRLTVSDEDERRHLMRIAGIRARIADAARNAGLSVEQARERMRSELRRSWQSKQVAIRVSPEALAGVLGAGRFKAQFEVGASGGLYDLSIRGSIESVMFGYGRDLSPQQRPVYGYLTGVPPHPSGLGRRTAYPANSDQVAQYGEIQVLLRSSTRSRTTACVGDSLDYEESTIPSLLDSPEPESFGAVSDTEPDYWDEAMAGLNRDYSGASFRGRGYMEAQVHGGVSVDDIEHVYFPREPGERMKQLLDERGVAWSVYDYRVMARGGPLNRDRARSAIRDEIAWLRRRTAELKDAGVTPGEGEPTDKEAQITASTEAARMYIRRLRRMIRQIGSER